MSSVVISGGVSGSVTLQAPSAAGSTVITLPSTSGTMASISSLNNNGVVYANSSGQPTTSTSFVFDGTNVGVGTSSPSSYGLLSVVSSTAGSAKISIQDTSGGASPAPLLQFGVNSSNGFNTSDAARVWTTSPSSTTASLNFAAYSGGAPSTAQMTLTGGNVGIGTSSPGAIANKVLAINGSDTGIQFQQSGTSTATIYNSAGELRFSTLTAIPQTFYTNSAERMRIDSSGNVGIGTNSPSKQLYVFTASNSLQIQSVVRNSNTGTGVAAIGFNVASTTEGDYTQAGIGLLRGVANGSGSLCFYNKGSGTASDFTTADEKMRIDSSGNLLVGTTSSNGRLSVDSAGATSATYAVYVRNSTPSDLLYIRSDGFFSTGGAASSPYNATTATAANVVVASNGQLQRSTSSLKYKTDVHDATHGLVDLLKLRSVTYKGKNNGDTIFGGLIAEEVDAAGLTEFVQYAEDGTPDALAYGNMVSLCIKAIQELKADLDATKAELAALKGAQS